MKYNKSYTYILPMFGESYLQFVKKNPYKPTEDLLLNIYTSSEYMPDHKEHLFLAYKYVDKFKPFYIWLEGHMQYVDKYEIEDEEDVIYVYCFRVPNKDKNSYKMFLRSKYSRMDDRFKRHICKFHNLSLDSRVSKILIKDESLYLEREAELDCDPIDRSQEIGSLVNLISEIHKKKVELKPNNKQIVIFD